MFELQLSSPSFLITKSILCTSPCIFCLENPVYHFLSSSPSLRPHSLLTPSPSSFPCWLWAFPHAHRLHVRTSSTLSWGRHRAPFSAPPPSWGSLLWVKVSAVPGELIPCVLGLCLVPHHHHCQARVLGLLSSSSAPSAAPSALSFGCLCYLNMALIDSSVSIMVIWQTPLSKNVDVFMSCHHIFYGCLQRNGLKLTCLKHCSGSCPCSFSYTYVRRAVNNVVILMILLHINKRLNKW